MNGDELTIRLRRIYSAIAATEEYDLNKVPPTVVTGRNFIGVFQDFRGGMTEEEIVNLAHQVIHNVANLRDNLRRWAEAIGKDPNRVWDTFNNSEPLKVIQDLSNNDKHGYPPKNGNGNSGIAPRVIEIDRVLKLSAKPGSGIALIMGPTGTRSIGDGSAMAVVTGQLINKDGKIFGDLYETELKALEAWENLLTEFGVQLP